MMTQVVLVIVVIVNLFILYRSSLSNFMLNYNGQWVYTGLSFTRISYLVLFVIIISIGITTSYSDSPTTLVTSGSSPHIAIGSDAFPAHYDSEIIPNQILQAYGKIPLSFEINQGQTDSQVKFLSSGDGYTIFFTQDKAVMSLVSSTPQTSADEISSKQFTIIEMQIVDVNPSTKIIGLDELPGKSNYFIGNDPQKWYTDIPNYAKIQYSNVYSGIDLIYYGNQRQLEYDFVVAPGANPKNILLAFEGAERLSLDDKGNLIIDTIDDNIIQHAPTIYQEINGIKQIVNGGYLLDENQVGFQVSSYDTALPLVIDPVLSYSTYLGGTGDDGLPQSVSPVATGFGIDITVDSSGNVYVVSQTTSTDFPTTSPTQAANAGGTDVFVTKINAAGSAHVYSTYLGGSDIDQGLGIAVDSSGNAYVTGDTRSTDFPTTNPIQASLFSSGIASSDAFVTKINAAGNAHVYSTYLGGGDFDSGRGIAVDSSGNAYVAGKTKSTDFPTMNPIQAANAGGPDAFVTKINAAGSAHVYSTYLGGSDSDMIFGIAVDSSGNAYVTGKTQSSNFPTTSAIQAAIADAADAFVTKINAAGNAHVYSTYLGGTKFDVGKDIAVDSSGNAYVAGQTHSTDFPTMNPIQTANAGGPDAFVTKINAAGSAHVYSTYLGGSGNEKHLNIAVDSSGNAYVAGPTTSTDFPTTSPIQAANAGGTDAFVTKINAAGSAHVYSTYLGGSGSEEEVVIAVDSSGNAYVAGQTASTDFPTMSPIQAANAGGFDAFVTKISDGPLLPPSQVTDLTLTVISGTQVDLSWTTPNNSGSPIIGYHIFRNLNGAGFIQLQAVADPTLTTFSDNTLSPGDKVTYGVRAVNAIGNAPPSNIPTPVTTTGGSAPDAVTDLTLTVISGTQVDLSWSPPADNGSPITGYVIVSKVNGIVSTIEISFGDASTTSYFDTSLSAGDVVTYKIAAINASGTAPFSNVPPNVTTPGGASIPDMVIDLTLTVISSNQVDMSWSTPADNGSPITGYKIDSKVNGVISTIETSFGDASTTSYSDTSLSAGDVVTYRIATINAVGQAPYSNIPTSVTTSGGDGILDIVVSNGESDNVSVLLGNGDGTFGPKTDYVAGNDPTPIALGDLDGDGILDIVTANILVDTISVLLGNGDKTFGSKTDFVCGDNPHSLVLGDLDGDDILDIVTGNRATDSVSVLLGNGDGTFGPKTDYAVGVYTTSVAVGDFDGDDILDIAAANRTFNSVSILLGNGDGTFGPKTDFAVDERPHSLVLGDLDGDDILDIVTGNGLSHNVSVLLGNGDGTFGPKTDFTVSDRPNSVAVGDLDGDDILDIVTSNSKFANVSILLGNGDGTFGPKTDYAVGDAPHSTILGDLDGDDILDIVTGNAASNNVSVLLGNGDGTFGPKTDYDVGEFPNTVALGSLGE